MELQDIGKEPVSPEHPAGSDPSYEPEFEQLQAEIDKLSAPSADGQGIDWDKVVALSRAIIATKSKHLPTAAYLAVALLKINGLPGLADGAQILSDMVVTYWDTLWPQKNRMRGRLNAVSWYREQLQAFIAAFTTDEQYPQELVDRLTKAFTSLDDFLGANVPDAPSLREILRFVGALSVAEPPAPAPEAASAQAAGDAQTAGAAANAGPATQQAQQTAPRPAAPAQAQPRPAPPGNADDPEAWFKAALQQMLAAAPVLLAKDVADPRAYALARLGAWMAVDSLPPADKGQTMIPPPDDAVAGSLGQLIAGRQFEDAARQAESLTPVYLFWLDLSWVSAQALEAMGAKGQAALDTVKRHTANYVARLKGIENLSFSDGTPFARPQTKAWLRTLGPSEAQAGGQTAEAAGLARAMGEADTLAAGGKYIEAVTLLQQALAQARSGRERFDALIAVSGLLSRAGRADLAGPNVDEMLSLIDQYKLEQWEPDTALRGFLAAYDVLSLDQTDEGKARTRQALSRVARINPAAAMRVSA